MVTSAAARATSNGSVASRSKSTVRMAGKLIVQGGVPILLTAMRAAVLPQHKRIDIFDPKTEQGYQRDPAKDRINKAADYYDEGGRMPNPLLANIREDDFERIELTILEGDAAAYDEAIDNQGTWEGLAAVEIPTDLELWVYDGQHRGGGIEEVLDRNRDGSFDDFPVPLAITLGLATQEEMKEFFEVNSHAKSVRTDLAWELLRQMAENNPKLAEELELTGQDWKLRGQAVVKELRNLNGPWKDSIQAPNEHRAGKSDRLTIPQVQFITALKPVLDMPLLAKTEPDKIAQIVNAYWQGIARVLPEPFDRSNNPKDWTIQKGVGVTPLFRALPRVIEVVRARGQRLGDPNAYADVMKDLPNMSGPLTDPDTGVVRDVSGEEFWRSGKEGVASAFTGESGRARLYVMIQALLPKATAALSI
jgi:DGQHR domain-containing protein